MRLDFGFVVAYNESENGDLDIRLNLRNKFMKKLLSLIIVLILMAGVVAGCDLSNDEISYTPQGHFAEVVAGNATITISVLSEYAHENWVNRHEVTYWEGLAYHDNHNFLIRTDREVQSIQIIEVGRQLDLTGGTQVMTQYLLDTHCCV